MRHGSVGLTEGLGDRHGALEQAARGRSAESHGYTELADKASRDLPDPVDVNRLEEWCVEHGLSQDDVISRMGGSP